MFDSVQNTELSRARSLSQMGVGAVYISTLAVTELPEPQSPPQSQAELLASTVQTIVAFVVLGSIIVRKSINTSFTTPAAT